MRVMDIDPVRSHRACRHVQRAGLAALLIGLVAMPALAYTQDAELEAALRKGDRKALALFPARGFKDGVAGFFIAHELHVVPGSERAWCATQARGVLAPGCYVEFVFQGKGLRRWTSRGEPCGCIARWYKAPGSKSYLPTPGAHFAQAMANDEGWIVDAAIYDDVRPDCR